MLYREINAVCSENKKKRMNTPTWQSAELFNVKILSRVKDPSTFKGV